MKCRFFLLLFVLGITGVFAADVYSHAYSPTPIKALVCLDDPGTSDEMQPQDERCEDGTNSKKPLEVPFVPVPFFRGPGESEAL